MILTLIPWSGCCVITPPDNYHPFSWNLWAIWSETPKTTQICCSSSKCPPSMHLWLSPEIIFTVMIAEWWFSNSRTPFTFIFFSKQVFPSSPLIYLSIYNQYRLMDSYLSSGFSFIIVVNYSVLRLSQIWLMGAPSSQLPRWKVQYKFTCHQVAMWLRWGMLLYWGLSVSLFCWPVGLLSKSNRFGPDLV